MNLCEHRIFDVSDALCLLYYHNNIIFTFAERSPVARLRRRYRRGTYIKRSVMDIGLTIKKMTFENNKNIYIKKKNGNHNLITKLIVLIFTIVLLYLYNIKMMIMTMIFFFFYNVRQYT